jgi:hypothetical protein
MINMRKGLDNSKIIKKTTKPRAKIKINLIAGKSNNIVNNYSSIIINFSHHHDKKRTNKTNNLSKIMISKLKKMKI